MPVPTTGPRDRASSSGGGLPRTGALLLLLLFLAHPSAANTARSGEHQVYASSSQGSDANDGSSPAAAVRTAARATALLQNGSQLLLRAGDAWAEPVVLQRLHGVAVRAYTTSNHTNSNPASASGAAAAAADFADTAPAQPRPRLWLGNYSYGAAALTLVDCNDTRVEGVDIGQAFYALRVLMGDGAVGAGTLWQRHRQHFPVGQEQPWVGPTVSDCVFRDVSNPTYKSSTGEWATAIHVGSTTHAAAAAAAAATTTAASAAKAAAWVPAPLPSSAVLGSAPVPAIPVLHNFTVTGSLFWRCDAALRNGAQYNGVKGPVLLAGMRFEGNTMAGCRYNTVELVSNTDSSVASNVFFHDAPTAVPFAAGTTDVIVGTVAGNAIAGNEFVARGEFPGAPDGCAIDFETNATGTVVAGNYFAHSYGAGVMVFGHAAGSNRGLLLRGNTFVATGCRQPLGDRGAVAFVHVASAGALRDNTYVACDDNGSVPIYNEVQPGAAAEWAKQNETVLLPDTAWAAWTAPPVLVVSPPTEAPTTQTAAAAPAAATAKAAGCFTVQLQDPPAPPPPGVVRYRADNAAPTEADAELVPGDEVVVCRTGALSAKRFWANGSSTAAAVIVDVDGGNTTAPAALG